MQDAGKTGLASARWWPDGDLTFVTNCILKHWLSKYNSVGNKQIYMMLIEGVWSIALINRNKTRR